MHLSAVRRPLSATLLAVAAALVSSAALAAPAIPTSDTISITTESLTNAIGVLHEKTNLNFVLDAVTIQQMGIDPTGQQNPGQLVNVQMENVKYKTVLRSILGQYNLSYAVVGETVQITSEEVAMYKQMHQHVNVDMDKVPLAAGLKQLARETATNLLVDTRVQKEAQTPVTLQLEDVPLETAVRLMAEMAALKPVRVGNVIFVTSKVTAAEIKADVEGQQQGQPPPGRQALEDIVVPGQGQIQIAVPAGAPVQPAPKVVPPPNAPAEGQKTETPDKPADPPPMDKDTKPAPADKPGSEKEVKPPAPPDKPKEVEKR
jgi:hypothetical protein